MATISLPAVEYTSTQSAEQHSIRRSLALHILPGIFILVVFVGSAPLIMRLGYPPILAIALGATVGLAFQAWHLLRLGRKQNGKWSLTGVVLYDCPMPTWQYFAFVPLFTILAFIIDGITTPLKLAMVNSLPWLPSWFEMRDTSLLLQYPKTVLMVTFGITLLINGIAAPIIEELYFRGYLMPRLSRFGRWTPVLETALFTLYHFWQPYYWIAQFLAMLPVVSSVFWKKNVRLGIFVHMAMNLVGGLLTAAMVLGRI